MESSDDSFAWSSASTDSEIDSDDTNLGNMAPDTKAENIYNDESESDSKYKRKLHKQLFQNQDDENNGERTEKKSKKSKMKEEHKEEPSPKKPRVKKESMSETHMETDENDEYLNMRVKQEQYTPTPVHTDTHMHETPASDHELSSVKKPKKAKKMKEHVNAANDSSSNFEDSSQTDKRKKKKKKPKHNDSTDFIKDKFSAEETVVQSPPHKKRKKHKNSEHVLESYVADSSQEVNGNCGIASPEPEHDTSLSRNRHSSLGDRIRFEDDSDADSNHSPVLDDKEKSFLLSKFLKANPNLTETKFIPNYTCNITKNDDLWLVRCPQDVDVTSLQSKELSLDGKCKIKIDGQTYDGTPCHQIKRITVLSCQNDKNVILNLPLNGIINFRKRIPKPHFVQDRIIVNKQTDFIPLPETKCRHPLFGTNYKKALKIPSTIKARLNDIGSESYTTISYEKKKKKKNKHADRDHMKTEVEPTATEVEPEPAPEEGRRKKRKHRPTEDETPHSKAKRVKHDPDSAAAWDSEKAIEENLFNF